VVNRCGRRRLLLSSAHASCLRPFQAPLVGWPGLAHPLVEEPVQVATGRSRWRAPRVAVSTSRARGVRQYSASAPEVVLAQLVTKHVQHATAFFRTGADRKGRWLLVLAQKNRPLIGCPPRPDRRRDRQQIHIGLVAPARVLAPHVFKVGAKPSFSRPRAIRGR